MWVSFSIVYFSAYAFGARILEECVISPNRDLPEPQPLLLQASSTPEVLHPNTQLQNKLGGWVKLYNGEEFELACPGTVFSDSKEEILTATCVRGTIIKVGTQNYNLKNLKCTKLPKPTARWTNETCVNGEHSYIEIGYEVGKQFLSILKVCFDDDLKTALYSVHHEDQSIYSRQHGYPRVQFQTGQFYKNVIDNLKSVYSVKKQREQIASILGSKMLASKYIRGNNTGYFLSRGHLSAKADFVYGLQQSATFFYVNVVPQWQSFNGGNWAALEDSVRSFVTGYAKHVTVYTGTYGVATLPNTEGVEQELYLYTDSNNNNLIPVPKLMWKLLYSEGSSAGVVFIGVNNPYLTSVTEDYLICTDVCDQITWLTWDQTNVKKGYSYCCEVNDFLQTVTTLPALTVTSLLK